MLDVAAPPSGCVEVHLELADVAVAPAPVREPAVALLRVPRRRADLRVAVPGHGVVGVLAAVAST